MCSRWSLSYLTVLVQPLPFSTLLPSVLRLLLAFGLRFANDFAHVWHCAFVQCVDVDAIAGTPKLPRLIAVAVAMTAIRLVGIM